MKRVYDQTVEELNEGGRRMPQLPTKVGRAYVVVEDVSGDDGPIAQVAGPSIGYEVAIHTARNREYGRAVEGDADSAVFRYRALARGQRLSGAVVVQDETQAEMIRTLLAGGDLHLGGSHTAGYGLTAVISPQIETDWREYAGRPKNIPAGKELTVYLTADAILRHPKTGQPTNDIRHFLPGGKKGYRFRHAFSSMTWGGGFNTTWELPLPQEWAVKQGSIWVLETKDGVSSSDLVALERRGVGRRTAEGFGALACEPHWSDYRLHIRRRPKPIENISGAANFPTLDDAAKRLLDQMRRQTGPA